MATSKNEVAKAKRELTVSERFMNQVVKEFTSGVGDIALTDFQKRLAQNYFMAIDSTLKAAEEKRKKKNEKYRDPVPVVWQSVNMEELARDVVSYARVGLDPAQSNHIAMVPFKKNATGKYDIGFIKGYRGIELVAVKYGLDVPDNVTVELVYSNDTFKVVKKDRNNPYDAYEFEIVNAFDRGEIVGGFYYHQYLEHPEKNKLVVFTLKDILKRKPQYASVEFWGGEKEVWEGSKKTGKKEQVEGWYEKMCWKTIYRAAYNDITIDSQKVDDDYLRLKQMEQSFAESEVTEEISKNANTETIDIDAIVVEEGQSDETQPEPEPESPDKDGAPF